MNKCLCLPICLLFVVFAFSAVSGESAPIQTMSQEPQSQATTYYSLLELEFIFLFGFLYVSNPLWGIIWTILSYVIFSIIGKFTKKRLNPRYEDLIERRINKVTLLILSYYGVMILFRSLFIFLCVKIIGVESYMVGFLDVSATLICGGYFYLCGSWISRLKGYLGWNAVFWGFLSLTLVGFPILWGCVSYRHVGPPVEFPVYSGEKIRLKCKSCGHILYDYECNIGTEGICGKCKTPQMVELPVS